MIAFLSFSNCASSFGVRICGMRRETLSHRWIFQIRTNFVVDGDKPLPSSALQVRRMFVMAAVLPFASMFFKVFASTPLATDLFQVIA